MKREGDNVEGNMGAQTGNWIEMRMAELLTRTPESYGHKWTSKVAKQDLPSEENEEITISPEFEDDERKKKYVFFCLWPSFAQKWNEKLYF